MPDNDYICPECKLTYPKIGNGYCVCGRGKLEKKFTVRDIEEIFPCFRKDKK